MASQWSSPPWQRPRRRPCRRTSPPQAPLLLPSPTHHGELIPPRAAATAALETARLLSGSRHDQSSRPPSLAYRGAIASRSPCHWWAGVGGGGGVSWHGGDKSW